MASSTSPNPLSVVDTPPPQEPIEALAEAFMRNLRYQGRSEKTITIYQEAIAQLLRFLRFRRLPLDPSVPTFDQILQDFFESLQERVNPQTGEPLKGSTVMTRFAGLHSFFAWATKKGHLAASPMARLDPPKITLVEQPVLTVAQVRAMLDACDVKRGEPQSVRFMHRRDRALLLTMFSTGIRRAECAAIRLVDLNLNEQELAIPHGKGDRPRRVALDLVAAEALDDFLIDRAKHPSARSPFLWLAVQGGPLGYSGIADVIDRVARAAGITFKVHPHLFRHTRASTYLAHKDAQEGDLMRLMGWTSTQMLRRYGASAAEERALAASKRLGIADKLLAKDPTQPTPRKHRKISDR